MLAEQEVGSGVGRGEGAAGRRKRMRWEVCDRLCKGGEHRRVLIRVWRDWSSGSVWTGPGEAPPTPHHSPGQPGLGSPCSAAPNRECSNCFIIGPSCWPVQDVLLVFITEGAVGLWGTLWGVFCSPGQQGPRDIWGPSPFLALDWIDELHDQRQSETPGPQKLTQDSYMGPEAWAPAMCELSDFWPSIIWFFWTLASEKGRLFPNGSLAGSLDWCGLALVKVRLF